MGVATHSTATGMVHLPCSWLSARLETGETMSSLQDFWIALDKAISHACDYRTCLLNVSIASHDEDTAAAGKACKNSRDCICDIQKLWPTIYNQQHDFLSTVVRQNARLMSQVPLWGNTASRSWHHFAINSLQFIVEVFYQHVNENHPIWSSPLLDYEVDKSSKPVTLCNIQFMGSCVPDFELCKAMMLSERDNFGAPQALPDGVFPPNTFSWQGKSEQLAPVPFGMLTVLWEAHLKQRTISERELIVSAYGMNGDPTEGAIQEAIKKVNTAIKDTDCALRVAKTKIQKDTRYQLAVKQQSQKTSKKV